MREHRIPGLSVRSRAFVAIIAVSILGAGCSDDDSVGDCPQGATLCSGVCVDTQVDPNHCGECGNACDTGESCVAGQCGLSCDGGSTECGGECVDTDVDPAHCGDCDTLCGTDEMCVDGQCQLVCMGGTTECGGECVDTEIDPSHCGGCADDPNPGDHVCDIGEVCQAGQCGLVCVGGTTECGGSCVDTDVDPNHCGGCGDDPSPGDHVCDVGEVCLAGQCGLACVGGTTECGGSCVDTDLDPENCGGCGDDPNPGDHVCVGDEECVAGVCEVNCSSSEIECASVCVNPLTDPNNCGGCGNLPNIGDHICPAGQWCKLGTCLVNDPPVVTFPTGLTVSGAGTAAVNGLYVEDGTHDGEPMYSFDNGGTLYYVFFDSMNYWWNIGPNTDVYSALYYNWDASSKIPETGWNTSNGTSPAPTVTTNRTFSGYPYLDGQVTADYLYSDVDGDPEGTSTFQWYRCTSGGPTPTGCTVITGATARTYVAQQADVGMVLAIEVTPAALTGFSPGVAAMSEGYGPILSWHLSHVDTDEFLEVKTVAALDGSIYVAYFPTYTSAPVVFHYDGTTKTVLNALPNAGWNGYLDLALDPTTGYPLLVYVDSTNDELLRIRRWSGSAWENLDYDVDAMVTWNVGGVALACDFNGAPVLSYLSDNGGGSPTYVARWNGSAWVQLGPSFAPDTNSLSLDVAVGPNNLPVYPHLDFPGHTIFRWDGSAWSALGGDFNSSQYDSAIQVDSSNTPTLWLRNASTSDLEVRQWDGSAWQMLGSPINLSFGVTANMEVSDVPTFTTSEYTGAGPEYDVLAWNSTTSTWDSLGVFCRGDYMGHAIASVLNGNHYIVLESGLILYQ